MFRLYIYIISYEFKVTNIIYLINHIIFIEINIRKISHELKLKNIHIEKYIYI